MSYILRTLGIFSAFRYSFIDIFGYVDVSIQIYMYVNIDTCQTENDVCLTLTYTAKKAFVQ